jgi:large conductance mechanosensitive channel protein
MSESQSQRIKASQTRITKLVFPHDTNPLKTLYGGTALHWMDEVAAVTINYGVFIQTIIDFLIIALAIFVAVKVINSMKRKEEEKPAEPPQPSEEVLLLREIRDALNKQ